MNEPIIMISAFAGAFLLGALLSWLIVKLKLNQQVHQKDAEILSLNARLSQEAEKLQWQQSTLEKLQETFENLANKALHENANRFLNQSKEQLENLRSIMKSDWATQSEEFKGLVNPIAKELDELDKNVRRLEEKREGAYRSLETYLDGMLSDQKNLHRLTSELNQALRSSTVAGSWGEIKLKRIVEMAGLSQHVDYVMQTQTQSGSGRPDMIVKLPNNGIIPVDSKVVMSHYLDSVDAASEQERKQKLQDHARAMRNTIQSLANKSYWSQFEQSPEYVVMLVPYESGLSAAFLTDPNLMEFALTNRVIVVSPGTLLALLKVIALGWLQLRLSENAKEIASQGKEVYERFGRFVDHLADVGVKLNASVGSFNKAVGSLESRVSPSVRKLKELGAGTTEITSLPDLEANAKLPDKEKFN